ncbi:hypothetical protein D3C85_1207320 [compost metagenome]
MQQRAHVDGAGIAARRRFQRGQGQQVFDDGLHALGLLVHHVDVLRALLRGQRVGRHVAQRFQEARQHGQGRAQFVRDVGDEVAARGFQAFDLRDVARDEQALIAGVGRQLHHHQPLLALLAQPHQDGFGPGRTVGVFHELRRAQQVQQVVAAVRGQAQTQVLARHAVAPVDLEVFIQGHRAVRQRLGGRQHALHGVAGFSQFAGAGPGVAVQRGEDVVPGPDGGGRRGVRVAGPVGNQRQPPTAPEQHGGQRGRKHYPARRISNEPLRQ